MARAKRDSTPQFTQPWRQVILLLGVLALIGLGTALILGFTILGFGIASTEVLEVILSNPYLNGLIGLVFLFGVLACFWQLFQLIVSVRWIESFAAENDPTGKAPQLLAPLATLLRSRGSRMQINASSSRSILDSVGTRIDEVRDITRYIVNLLIFLGLLGTFYGLATTVPGVVDTIRSLTPKEGDSGVEVFNRLKDGLETQMAGMGVAFSSSLLGLAGSLIVGLLELFVGHGQNRFYRELEEWLSSITRVGFASSEEGGGDATAAFTNVIDHMAEQMESLQQMFTQSDVGRSMVDDKLGLLTDSLEKLLMRMEDVEELAQTDAINSNELLGRIADGQDRLIAAVQTQEMPEAADGMDAESRMRLRSIDVQMLRILEEISAGRQESTADLRGELIALRKAISGQDRGITQRLRSGTPPRPDGV